MPLEHPYERFTDYDRRQVALNERNNYEPPAMTCFHAHQIVEKTLKDRIITINTMEEEADRIFISNMRKLHTSETSPLDIIIWRDVYRYLEQCADACEHVADVCERVLMNNT